MTIGLVFLFNLIEIVCGCGKVDGFGVVQERGTHEGHVSVPGPLLLGPGHVVHPGEVAVTAELGLAEELLQPEEIIITIK